MNYILLQIVPNMDWNHFFFGKDEVSFLWEVLLRSTVMFFIILIGLVILGKRGVTQLSVFELIVILSLGSAAGDSMFYKDVGLVPATLVFVVVILLYKVVIFTIGKSKKVERLMEGKPVYLIKNGKFSLSDFDKEPLAYDEFFSELRLKGVSHLGQVDKAIVETNGQLSLFYFKEGDVKFGLPILPADIESPLTEIIAPDIYACMHCGHPQQLIIGVNSCEICDNKVWVKAKNEKRIL
jgi:uncharacterized membrane protein YcaP (DUF421 family)